MDSRHSLVYLNSSGSYLSLLLDAFLTLVGLCAGVSRIEDAAYYLQARLWFFFLYLVGFFVVVIFNMLYSLTHLNDLLWIFFGKLDTLF